MTKKTSIIVLWVVGIITILMFGYISYKFGFLPILKTTTPKGEGDILSIWTICLFAAFCALVGGIGTIVALYYLKLLKDTLGQQLKLDDQTIATEVLNLKNHIRTIYSIVPVVFIFLSLFGIQGYNELNEIRGVAAIKEAKTEWPNMKTKWDSIDRTVSAKANSAHVDTTFLKLTKAVADSIKVSQAISAKANSAHVDTTFLKLTKAVADSIKVSQAISAKANNAHVDTTFLKLTKAVADSIKVSQAISAKANNAHVDTTFLKLTKAVADSIKVSQAISAKANNAHVDTTFLKLTKAVADSIKVSQAISAKANNAYVDTTFLKTSELETMITQLKSDKLRAWIKAQTAPSGTNSDTPKSSPLDSNGTN